MKYYIIAGEASGDLHGGHLIAHILASDPEAEFRFWGGDKMAGAAGDRGTQVMHYRETSIMGYLEVLLKMRTILGFIKTCKADIAAWNPDTVVFIDYPGFNLKIAQWAHTEGFKTAWYIAPKVWAWKEGRAQLIKKYVDKLLVIFPFEVEWFAARGIEATYVGNPLLDELAGRTKPCQPLDLRPLIALVAGSRKMELEHNLRPMVEVAKILGPGYRYRVTGVDWLPRELYDKILGNSGVEVVFGKTYETFEQADAALVTSGTATLEAALLGVPEAVCYRGPKVSMWIARRIVKLRWISLVNLIMNRTVVPELIGGAFTPAAAAAELRTLLPMGTKRAAMLAEFDVLREKMGGPGASLHAATEIIALAKR